jgi:hypothetical protein
LFWLIGTVIVIINASVIVLFLSCMQFFGLLLSSLAGLLFSKGFSFLVAAEAESIHLLSELTDSAEFEGFRKPEPSQSDSHGSSHPEPWLRNRLRNQKQFWSTFCTSLMVLSVISVGYMLPWVDGPPVGPHFQKNHPSAFDHPEFVTEAVSSLVITGAAMRVSFRPWIVSPLGVVPKGIDKLRLILDLRYVNSFLKIEAFKYESLRSVPYLCKLRVLLFSVDLKSGYHHVDIHPDYWKYLGFEWNGDFYVFCQLPFGLASACYVFSKITKQLAQRWRSMGIRVIAYIDDFFFVCSTSAEFFSVQRQVISDFTKAGFVLSVEKCQLQQSHVVKFLGFVIDSIHGVFRLTALQKDKLRSAIASCLANPSQVPAKLLARVTGLITSMSLVTGPVSGLFSRYLHRDLDTRSSWRGKVALSSQALVELGFWLTNLENLSVRSLWPVASFTHVLHYDAGANGWGGHLVVDGQEHRAHGAWAADERHGIKSSTWRELEGLSRLLVSFRQFLQGRRVTARGDAMNVFHLLNRGGSQAEHLQEICLRIFWFCQQHNILLEPEWIPREQNQLADYLSKVKELDDFGLQPPVFARVAEQFGPLAVDRFASAHNALLPVFFSEYWSPHSSGVNAFTDNWSSSRSYCFPPPRLVFRTIEHARECKADIVLVVLDWPGQPWWPVLVGSGGHTWAPFVKRSLRFPKGPCTLRPGRFPEESFFGRGYPLCDVIILDISFSGKLP